MAIVKEFLITRQDGVNLYKTYSDEYYVIQKVDTDEFYEEAIDVEGANYAYIETEQKIENIPTQPIQPTPSEPDEELVQKAKAYDILMGECE